MRTGSMQGYMLNSYRMAFELAIIRFIYTAPGTLLRKGTSTRSATPTSAQPPMPKDCQQDQYLRVGDEPIWNRQLRLLEQKVDCAPVRGMALHRSKCLLVIIPPLNQSDAKR